MATDREVSPWNIANVLTMLRILMVPVFAWLFLQDGTVMRVAATAVFVAAALTDKLDGHLARSRGLITDLGKILDPIADKALVIAALVLLSLDGLVPWWVTLVIIVRELGITVLRFFMIRREVMAASRGGKLKATLQMVFIVGMLVPWSALLPSGPAAFFVYATIVLMYLAAAVTVWTGVEYVLAAARISRAHR
ncbi:MAG: CDP-diacylglycerol--glycerol-3-phosphate 3-phosphatidyltransferase [Actinomycetes bacterium]|nr:CDP-diacylglycerol--glycerol-3-phosphate 3-phosphatidyltransferase [Actinomycetes bacterium]MDX5380557.1 CDP-diacylglycerol--glycerol-3-phosphate 3-phosphatidyltransferase [Actinomycetes bacterium]MDX5399446.1 CDP-diacylglycerol--glycerol-3-phosphate 3-phosphatidyltransferase [Actinomycetes bacterium]MDX5450297.1 CDP-diacylglycerol--glycerol-3-phosphate 3-phosphatidyltransferase [Actinomycetes bacterium]